MKSILIIGGSGFVGSHLAGHLGARYKVVTTHFRHPLKVPETNDLPLSVAKLDWLKEMLFSNQPEVIIYAAGRSEPEWTEDPKNAKALDLVQVAGPTAILSASQMLGSKVIYLSSSHVFDATRGNYYETDVTMPITAMGKVKVGAENSIRGRALNYLILRSPPLLGRGPASHPTFVDRWAFDWGRGHTVAADDQIRHNYATMSEYCAWVQRCIESPLKNRILHFGGLSRTSEYELACSLAARFGVAANKVVRKPATADKKLDYSLNFTQSVKLLEVQPMLLKQSIDLLEENLLVSGA